MAQNVQNTLTDQEVVTLRGGEGRKGRTVRELGLEGDRQ